MAVEIKVIIPSLSRAMRVTTTRHIKNCILCVPKSQEKDYKHYNPYTEIVAHPDSVIGMGPKRNWIYAKWGNIFMVDDDIPGINTLYETRPRILKADEAYDVIQNVGNIAALCGCHLFGISKYAGPLRYSGLKPIRLTGYINSVAIGMLGKSLLKYNEKIAITNYAYISCLNAYYYRKCYIDDRFGVKSSKQGMNKNVGGSSMIRMPDSEEKDNAELIRCFGTDILRFKQQAFKSGKGKKFSLSIRLPF